MQMCYLRELLKIAAKRKQRRTCRSPQQVRRYSHSLLSFKSCVML
uniref:Uncharacterized protein n=1 Tax=Anguilla anguilla TaxID=7936 RepID=A0A0E9VJV2_ANGAN